MANEDGSVWTVFNGEIWNYRPLRSTLQSAGHVFKTESDTEVLVHGFEEWGERLPHHLDGMFAFAVWDDRNQSLLLARDRIGKKPLYYGVTPLGLAFGSDARSVLIISDEPASVAADAVPAFLAQRYIAGSHTMFEGVRRLLPGSQMTYQDGRAQLKRYWELPTDFTPKRIRPADLRACLRTATSKRLMSDVPVGVLLSGGIDSAAVLGLARESGGEEITAFTIGFQNTAFDERPLATITARANSTLLYETVVSANDFAAALPRLTWYRDEPIAEPAEVPLLLLAEFAGKHVKVVLSGEGGDELFGGYPKYRAERMLAFPTPFSRFALTQFTRWQARRRGHRQLQRAIGTLAIPDTERRWPAWFRSFSPDELSDLLRPPYQQHATHDAISAPLASSLAAYRHLDPLQRMLMADVLGYLPDNLLLRADKVLMAGSIEGRMPILDREVVEAAIMAPISQRASLSSSKKVLRSAVQTLFPHQSHVLRRRGFLSPSRSSSARGRR